MEQFGHELQAPVPHSGKEDGERKHTRLEDEAAMAVDDVDAEEKCGAPHIVPFDRTHAPASTF